MVRGSLLGVVIGAMLVAGAAFAQPEGQPRLRLVSDSPLEVVGSGFRPHEPVRLLVSPGAVTRTLRAGALGRFRLVLRLPSPRCGGGVVVQAFGGRGSRAAVDRLGPACFPID